MEYKYNIIKITCDLMVIGMFLFIFDRFKMFLKNIYWEK